MTIGPGLAGSLLVGLVGAAIGELRVPVLRQIVRVYVEAIRNTPLLVQIFALFFVLPNLGMTLSPFTVGYVALVAWGGAGHSTGLVGQADRRCRTVLAANP